MKYQCIKCKNIWGKWETNEDQQYYSHGLCRECTKDYLVPKIKNNQIREGNFPCFGECFGYCDQTECEYRKVCIHLHTEVDYEKE